MNQGQLNSEVSGAQANGAALQAQYNKQAAQQYSAYQGTQNQANSAYGNLLNYTKSMADPEQLYNQALGSAQQMYGFDPTQLLKANQALSNTNTTLANLPQAIQQQGNYYGTTAGAEAGNYANQAGGLNNVMQGQSNAVNAYQQVLAATQNQANQSATLGFQGEQQKSSNYQQLYSTAVNQMQTAGQTLNQLQTLQQQQGSLTAQQVSAYQNAYSQYIQSAAAAAQSYAQANYLGSETSQQNMQNQQTQSYMNSQAYQNYLKYGTTSAPASTTKPAAAPSNSSNSGGFSLTDAIKSALNKVV